MAQFETGANRTSDQGKLDYEGFFSPLVLERRARYTDKHRHTPDGKVRASDNWQLGIPFDRYAKSLWRHLMDFWKWHRGVAEVDTDGEFVEEALCAILFNAEGYLHEWLKQKRAGGRCVQP